MAEFTDVLLATLTRNRDDAGTDARQLNVTINIDGVDQLDRDFAFHRANGPLVYGIGPEDGWLDEGQAAISTEKVNPPIESSQLTNSSIRIGIRDDDAWSPQHVLVMGQTAAGVEALAMETDLGLSLSTDSTEGHLTMPVRLVSQGTDTTVINRLLLLVYTKSGPTDSPIELKAGVSGQLVVQQTIPDTPQSDEEDYTANWYFVDVVAPFTREGLRSKGEMRLGILGTDAWTPESVFVFGLDTASGRPDTVVRLVSITQWTLGDLSSDPSEGSQSVVLPVG